MHILKYSILLFGAVVLMSALLLADEDKKTGDKEAKAEKKTTAEKEDPKSKESKPKKAEKKPVIIQRKIKVNARGNAGGIIISTEPDPEKKSTRKLQTTFKLPDKLPNGAVPKFHNADEKVRIEYSGGTELIVYFYSDLETLKSDYSAFKEVQEEISEQDSKQLAKLGGIMEKTDRISSIYFVFEDTVVTFAFKAGTDKETLISAGEKFLADEAQRRAAIFATPEITLAAARRAVRDNDYAVLRIAFPDVVSEDAEDHLSQLRAEYERMRKQRGVTYYRNNIEFEVSLENKTDNEAIITIKASDNRPRIRSNFMNTRWIRAIFGMRAYAGIEIHGLRCFLFKQDGRWFIDIDRNLTEDAEMRTVSDKEEPSQAQRTVTKVLRIIHEFQSSFYTGDLDSDRKKDYAQTLEELIETAGDKKEDLQTLLKLASGYTIKVVAKDGEPNWYTLASPNPERRVSIGGRRIYSSLKKAWYFYIDETGIVRFEIGKPANSKSKQYEE
ncbi:MAG: hypothetical protein E3J72_17045 [Planctomycetota bacterium]|nr:MAG: hypothetical protein E3J72_17045 [Planctomycetota bacterium]